MENGPVTRQEPLPWGSIPPLLNVLGVGLKPEYSPTGSASVGKIRCTQAIGAEPAGLQPGEFVATAGVAQANRELVADESAATTGEDRRTPSETCSLLL